MAGEFENAVEMARQLEKKAVAYAPYGGEVEAVLALDLEPKDFVDLTYRDMLGLYERSEKIRGTVAAFKTEEGRKAAAAAPAAPPAAQTAASLEIETKLKNMTTEALRRAEEVAKEPMTPEKEPEPAKAEEPRKPYEMEIEFEHRPAEEKPVELERETRRGPEAKREEGLERPVEKAAERRLEIEKPEREAPAPRPAGPAPAVEVPVEKKVVITAVPPALRESPDAAAARKYAQMEEQVEQMLGGATDEVSIKKKMLELTKELFREKSVNRREQIKMQISVMKNMLTAGIPGAGRKKKAAAGEDARGRLLDTIVSTQQAELAQTKDSIIDSYNRQMASIRKRFYDDIARVEEPAKRKEVFESFVFSVTSLVEQLPDVIRKYQDYTVKKHATEVDKLLASLEDREKATAAKAKERAHYIRTQYAAEFAPVKGIIGRQIEALIDSAGSDVFEKAEGEKEDKAMEAVAEINGTNEGTLLAYLQSKDSAFYSRYEKKQMSRAEAIARAKALLAKEKGLGDALTRKYFSGTEA